LAAEIDQEADGFSGGSEFVEELGFVSFAVLLGDL
jgi:hypothetical protein